MAVDAARVKSLFLDASELADPAERAAYLERECGADGELRQRVEALLAADDGGGRSVEGDAGATSEPTSPATLEATAASRAETRLPTELATAEDRSDGADSTLAGAPQADRPGGSGVGQVIAGRYTLLEVLGEGGMGTVYRAGQTQPVRRQVALKLIKVGMDSRAVLARFDAERQALALMDHPNIARVYDGGSSEAGQPFFVMELVSGEPITEYCDRLRLPVRARLELFVAVCQAVQHAHQKGIIHRDLKPSNVMVTEVDGRPTPKVIDFGVAKATEFSLTDQSLADTGAIVGTPTYMSPEQADPSSMDIDTRTDVYALGVILYELLVGSPPIDAKQFKRGAILEMLRMVREVDPPRPSTKVSTSDALPSISANRDVEPAQLKRALQGDLDWVVMKALEKDRTRRYETANGFAADILRHLAHEPVVAAPPSREYRLRKFVRKHRGAVIAATVVVLALLTGIAGTTLGLIEAKRQEQEAKRQERIARDETAEKENARFAEAKARGEAVDLATKEAKARDEADKKAEQLAREDYVNRVNRAYYEVQEDNCALAEALLHGCPPRRRGWEWHLVERLCNADRLSIDLGDESVNALAFSPDGTWVVSGAGSATFVVGFTLSRPSIDVWDVSSGRRRKTLLGAKGTVYTVAVSPDGKQVAAGCGEFMGEIAGLVLVWNVETGQSTWTRSEPGLNAMSVAFSPDGKSLAVGYGVYSNAKVGRVKVWDVASGTEIKAFTGPRGGVNAVAFHPDGKRLAVAGSEVVEVWDLETARKLHDLKGHKKWVYCVAYSPDGKWLATGGWDRTVKLRDAATGTEALTIFAQEGFVLSLGFSPDSRNLVTTSEDRSIRLWDVPSGRRLGAFHGHSDFVQAVAFRPDGREVVTGGADASIRFWDLKTSRPVVVEQDGWIFRLAFRRDGLRVLSAGSKVEGWNPLTGELDTSLAGSRFEKLPAGFVPPLDTQQMPLTSPDGKLVVRKAQKGVVNDRFGVVASRSKQHNALEIIEKASGRVVHTLTGHSADVTAVIFSPDGRRLATASFDRTVKFWDVQTGEDVFTLRGHTAGLSNLAFSPDGNLIISGGADNTARVWNATPLASDVIAKHDARYWKEIEALTHSNLESANDEARRAESLADAGQWGMAAEAFARAVGKDPGRLQLRYRLVDALLQAGDRIRVGPVCADILKRFGHTGDPLSDMAVAGLCRMALQETTDPENRRAVHELAPPPTDDFQRAVILAKFGHYDLVASGVTKHLEQTHDDEKYQYFYFVQCVSLVAMGDLQGYRSAADKVLSRSGNMSDLYLTFMAWCCTLAPDAVTDLAVPVRMVEKAMAAPIGINSKEFTLFVLGAALYRAGRIDEAIARLEMSEKSYGKESPPNPESWIYLAMAHHKKGNADEARRWLEKARSHKPAKPKKVLEDLKDRLLLKEAEELLSQKSFARH